MGNSGGHQADADDIDRRFEHAGERRVYRHDYCKYLSFIRTVVGLATVIAVFGGGWNAITLPRLDLGIYLLVLFVPVTVLEFSFLINKCTCCGNEGCCCTMWHIVMWMDSWKRGVLYVLVAIPTVIWTTFFGIIAGILLVATGILYCAGPWQYTKETLFVVRGETNVRQNPPSNSERRIQDPSGEAGGESYRPI